MPENSRLSTILLGLWRHLSRRRKREFFLLLALIFLSSFAEIISLGAVLPFIALLSAPERTLGNPLVAKFASTLGIVSANEIALPLTVVFVAAALIAGGLRILLWTSNRLAYAAGSDLSIEVYRRTLKCPLGRALHKRPNA